MAASNSILVIIEPDIHPHEVIDRAIWLARISDCSLDILLCDPDVGPLREGWYLPNEAKEIGENIRAAQKEIIEDLADNAREMDIKVNTGVLEDRPIAEGILHRVRETNPRYLMKGTHYHSAAERAIFVDTDWQLIRAARALFISSNRRSCESIRCCSRRSIQRTATTSRPPWTKSS